jgi:hypothetical protein
MKFKVGDKVITKHQVFRWEGSTLKGERGVITQVTKPNPSGKLEYQRRTIKVKPLNKWNTPLLQDTFDFEPKDLELLP